MNLSQPCGGDTGYGCGKPVLSPQGRRPGQASWHHSAACQSEYRRARYARLCARTGKPLCEATCVHCGAQYRKRANQTVSLFCSRPRCAKERNRRYQLARTRAWVRLVTEQPDRMAELLAEEAARIAAGVTA